MTKIEKQMIIAVVGILIVSMLFFYQMTKALRPIAANVEKNGIKPYIMQLWEGKKN